MKSEREYREVVDALERGPSIIVPLVREVPEALRKRRPSPGKWSAHEHACHLAERELSPDALREVDLEEALEQFQRQRSELVARLRALRSQDWERTAEHEEYSHYSLFILFRHAAMHDMLHAYRIEECLLRKDWT